MANWITDKRHVYRRQLLGLGLLTLVFVGYPASALIATFLGAPSGTLTVAYRGLVAALSAALVCYFLFRPNSATLRPSPFLAVFFFLYVCRLIYDAQYSAVPDANTALLFFVIVVALPVFATSMSGVTFLPPKQIAFAITLASGVVCIVAIAARQVGLAYNPWAEVGEQANRLMFENLNPISLGHVGGIAVLTALILLMDTKLRALAIVLTLSSLVAGIAIILLANSRGPILALIAALFALAVLRLRRLFFLIPICLALPVLLSFDSAIVELVAERIGLDPSRDPSVLQRLLVQQAAIESFLTYPLVGEHYLDPEFGPGNYPHNLFLETAMALGVVGLLLFLVLVWKGLWRARLHLRGPSALFGALFIQQTVASSLSGALWGADGFFLALQICLLAPAVRATSHGR